MRRLAFVLVAFLVLCLKGMAQDGVVENRPYTDLRPFHFGILVGAHLQDLEFVNVGPQVITYDDGTQQTAVITADQDRWDNGFNVGVLAEARISEHFQFRLAPTLYFGTRHISFHNLDKQAPDTAVSRQQTMKSVYIGASMDMIYASKRNGNCRPYMMMGLSPVINLTGKDNDYIKLKRYDVYFEAGLGCDFYLPFFKLRPELKFMYSLTNSLDTKHASLLRDESMRPYALAVNKSKSKMIVLTFYFE